MSITLQLIFFSSERWWVEGQKRNWNFIIIPSKSDVKKKKKKGKKTISYHNIWWTSCPPKVMKKENNFIFGELTYWPFNSCWKSVMKYMMISWIQYLIHRLGQYWSKNTTCPSASPKNKMVAEESNLWNAFVFFLFFFRRLLKCFKVAYKNIIKETFKNKYY